MSLPPRALNAFRLGSVAFKVRACFSSASFTPVSKLKVLKSQFGSSKTILLKKPLTNASSSAPPGCCPVIHNDQPPSPASPPNGIPGRICSPLEFTAPAWIFLSAANCAALRQPLESAVSPCLQSRVVGSNAHLGGSLSRPSLTPSCASQAASTAALIAGILVAGI